MRFFPRSLQANRVFAIAGQTLDAGGNVLPGCWVQLYDTAADALIAQGASGADGTYSFSVQPGRACYVVAYLAGSPDVAGTTVNTLTAS